MKRVPGVADVDTNGGLIRELHINLKTQPLQQWNVDLLALKNRIQTLGQNIGAGYIEQEGENLPLTFWDQNLKHERGSIETLMRAPVRNHYAQNLPFAELVQAKKEKQINPIARWYGQRYSALAIELNGNYDTQTLVNQAQDVLQKNLELP